jgi:predicted nucleotidyltransferase component of viral defense system
LIDAQDVIELAGELSLDPATIEKDYVLGWLLAGISRHPELGPRWIFKGGTCLKKVYFETYRFSEDLDFTISTPEQIDEAFLARTLRETAEWIHREAGIEIPADQIRVGVFRNPRGQLAAQARIYYRGPLQPRGSLPGIRLDLTADERVVLDPIELPIHHPYGDRPDGGIAVRSYPFAEVFAEKIRALGDRGRPRDLYDVVNLYRTEEAIDAAANVREILAAKCAFKGIPVPSLASLEPLRSELAADWEHMLGHQLPALPPFESFWDELPGFFEWLGERERPPAPPPYELAAGEQVIRPALGTLAAQGLPGSASLERIRFAAVNRLCVDLDYTALDGRRSVRRIEPYSLRRTQEGNVVLHALRADSGSHRSYRVERINAATVSNQVFVAKYAIELSPASPVSISPTSERRSPTARLDRPRGRRTVLGGEPRYLYGCPYCGKIFRRPRADPNLRPHKDRIGLPCPGRVGYYQSGP